MTATMATTETTAPTETELDTALSTARETLSADHTQVRTREREQADLAGNRAAALLAGDPARLTELRHREAALGDELVMAHVAVAGAEVHMIETETQIAQARLTALNGELAPAITRLGAAHAELQEARDAHTRLIMQCDTFAMVVTSGGERLRDAQRSLSTLTTQQ